MKTSRTTSSCLAAAILILVFAAGLRAAAAVQPLWLDEIWSLHLLERVDASWEVFTKIHHDNNHYLNTLALYWAGDGQPWMIYRLPAIVAGVLTVLAAGWIAGSRGRVAQLTVLVLFAGSYLLVHYASEARGYSSAVLAALLAYETLRRFLARRQTRWAAAFAASVVFGLLSHLMFVHVYGAAICWSLTTILAGPTSGRRAAWDLSRLHALPTLLLALLYWVDIRHLEFGGGPDYELLPLVLQAGSLSLGGPSQGWLAWLCLLLLLTGVAAGVRLLQREGSDDYKFLLLVILLPVVQIVAAQPQFMFVRYFLFAIAFSLLLVGYGLAELFRRKVGGRVLFAGLLLFFVLGNLRHYARLIEHGRGQYLAALEFMAQSDSANPLTISGDHNHGIRKLVQFYAAHLARPREVVYYDANAWPATGPEWLILHQYGDLEGDPFEEQYVVEGQQYRRQRVFETAILSGWRWHCYRREDGEAQGRQGTEAQTSGITHPRSEIRNLKSNLKSEI